MSFRNYYDTSYGRTRGDSSVGRSTSTDRPASVTAKYINTTPTYKSSSIPIRRERSATREQNESPITAIANKYANYKLNKDDKSASKYTDKKESYNKLSVPILTTNKSRDVSPVSTSSKYSLNRSSRHLSPDRRNITSSPLSKGRSRDPSPADRDKDIPNKTDKSSSYNGLSSYKIYPRTSTYTRPTSRAENKPEITVNRYAIANRIANNYLRSPSIEKSSRTSVSPINHIIDNSKIDNDRLTKGKSGCDASGNDVKVNGCKEIIDEANESKPIENGKSELDDEVSETIIVITRHTSPTPPGNSAYIRSRRAEMAKTFEKTITRSRVKPEMVDKEIQSDRLDDTSRTSRFAGTSRTSVSNWSPYTPTTISHYTGYAGRYSTQYGSTRECTANNNSSENNNSCLENNSDISIRSNESLETEKIEAKDVSKSDSNVSDKNAEIKINHSTENKDNDETSEIIINVNLKLKKAKTTELVSPEITITNSQLPPQPPKPEGSPTKIKKVKVRKSSTDSSSDTSSKKKVVKKRSKSVSSTDSEQSNENKCNMKTSDSHSPSPPKSLSRNSSTSNLKSKSIHKSPRESNSPESSITLSTQSSMSEDESITKSKTMDLSRTSADNVTISLDRSNKQQSPTLNEGTEEAKSFLIRALAPVTSLFKMKQPDSSENSHWLDNSTSESTGKDVSNLITESDVTSKSKTDNIIASNSENVIQLKSVKQFDSEENKSWIGGNSSNASSHAITNNNKSTRPENNNNKKIKHVESGERAWWLESNSESKNDIQNKVPTDTSEPSKSSKSCKFGNYDKEEKPWWLDSCANIPEGVQRLTPPRKVSSDSDKSEKFDFYKIRHNESGDKDWWLTSNENTSSNKESQTGEMSKSSSDHRNFPLRRIRHVESGERPWWLSSAKNIPEGVEKLPTPPPRDSDSSDSDEVDAYARKPTIPPFPLNLPDDEPLGDRRSPEGLETPRENEGCAGRRSPYENSIYRRGQGYKGEKYIARYTDIDDLLPGQMYSPYVDVILVRRTGQKFDGDSSECEEIDPTQVRIHDSTAQMPVIKKIRCRSELELVDYHEDSSMKMTWKKRKQINVL